MTERCSACGTVRDLAEMLIVSEVGGLHRSKYICRPNIDGRCLATIGPRAGEAIALAVPEAPLLPRLPGDRQGER